MKQQIREEQQRTSGQGQKPNTNSSSHPKIKVKWDKKYKSLISGLSFGQVSNSFSNSLEDKVYLMLHSYHFLKIDCLPTYFCEKST